MLRNGTRVPRGGFAAAKIFAEEGVGLRNLFRSGGPFSQPNLDFAADTKGLRNYFAADGHFRRGLFWAAKFRRPLKFLGFELLFAPWDLLSFSSQFLLQKIIQIDEVTYN